MDRVTGVSSALTPLQQWATQVHEVFTSLQWAGFSEPQSIAIVAAMQRPTETGGSAHGTTA